ncbi:MAG: universal stress protein [Candidatus Thiodiazotropha sp.]
MESVKNLVVALDLSPASWEIIEQASALYSPPEGRHIWLLHIAQPDADFIGYEPSPRSERDVQASTLHHEHQTLQTLAERVRETGAQCTALQIQGAYVDKILEEAEKLNADLIAVGSHGKGVIKQLLLGSTSNTLVRLSQIPILVIPTHD